MTSMRGPGRLAAWGIALVLVVVSVALLAYCSRPSPSGPPSPPAYSRTIPGWKLTLPVPGPEGDAATREPAQTSPPWLTRDHSGSLTFWAPVNGATTAHSKHARTELISLDTFQAGRGRHTLSASVSVTQVPTENHDVIIGQIHGAEDIRSVPFVMLHYRAETIKVVVKQEQSGSDAQDVTLLSGVPVGARFDYGIRDNGDGSLTFTARYGSRSASADEPLPDAFRDATVRFQAGAYQQGNATDTADDDGARVTFYTLEKGSQTVVTSSS